MRWRILSLILFCWCLVIPASAWWDGNWSQRIYHGVKNSDTSDFSGYQTLIYIYRTNGDSVDNIAYLPNVTYSNCSDIRIVDASDSSEVPFWINDSHKDATNTYDICTVWIRIPTFTRQTTTGFYIYYNSTDPTAAVNKSDGYTTFEYYSHFNEGKNTSQDDTFGAWVDYTLRESNVALSISSASSKKLFPINRSWYGLVSSANALDGANIYAYYTNSWEIWYGGSKIEGYNQKTGGGFYETGYVQRADPTSYNWQQVVRNFTQVDYWVNRTGSASLHIVSTTNVELTEGQNWSIAGGNVNWNYCDIGFVTKWAYVNETHEGWIVSDYAPAFSCTAPLSGSVPRSVSCTDDSSAVSAISYSWSVENGSYSITSTDENPLFPVSFADKYNVNMSTTTTNGEYWENKTGYLTLWNPNATILYTLNKTFVNDTMPVYLNDLSTGTNLTDGSYNWSVFNTGSQNDFNVSSDRNWTHVFPAASEYDYYINHSVTDSPGTPWENVTWYNTTTPLRVYGNHTPSATILADPLRGEDPATVTFTGSQVGSIYVDIWTWNFGDGGSSSSQSPTHIYYIPGTYTVSVDVFNSTLGNDTITRTDYITITVHHSPWTTSPEAAAIIQSAIVMGMYVFVLGVSVAFVVTLILSRQW